MSSRNLRDIDPIFFKLAGNKNMHNIMNEFEFRPERTTDYGVSCPWASKKYPYRSYYGENCVSTFSLLFLIGSFWYFHVTRTSIKAWMSLHFFNEIWPWHIGLRWAIVALWATCFLNWQQMGKVIRAFCWHEKFVPKGLSALAPGLYTYIKSLKMCIKSGFFF